MCNHFVGFFLQPANIFIAKSNLGVKLIDFGSARRIKNWKEGDMLAIVSYVAFTGELHKSESTFVITIAKEEIIVVFGEIFSNAGTK